VTTSLELSEKEGIMSSLELSKKEGIMSFSIPINIATAVIMEIYERLCWIYITVKNTLVNNRVGSNTYHLSDITEIFKEGFHIWSSSQISLIMSRHHCFRTSE
jgi:hypothetical protein